MKKIVLIIAAMALSGCWGTAEVETREDRYESGWSQARYDGCDCDPAMNAPRLEREARASDAWANGYFQGCRWMNTQPVCRDTKPSLALAQRVNRSLWRNPDAPPPAKP